MTKSKNNIFNKSLLNIISVFVFPVFAFFVIFVIYFLFFSFFSVSAANNDNNEDYLIYAKEQEQILKTRIAPYKEQVNELIKNTEKRQLQPDIQEFKREIKHIAKSKCSEQYKQYEASQQNQKTERTEKTNLKEVPIIIFVSFSMPKESIKGWIAQAQKAKAAIYIRGLINNSFKDTAKAISELVQNQENQAGGILIDPNLFKKYSITQVPAVVVIKNEKNDFDVIYGDVSLDYALDKISNSMQEEEKEGKKDLLRVIKQIRK